MRLSTSKTEALLKDIERCADSGSSTADGLGVIMAGTPEFLADTRRGLYSYAALQSRLAENAFAQDGLVDFSSPVLRLPALSPEEFYLLIGKIRHAYAYGDYERYLIPDEGLHLFMEHCRERLTIAVVTDELLI